MTFATATIQGFVNWKGKVERTPQGRDVINLLVSVPEKRKENTSTTYKLSIWDKQALSCLNFISTNQLITATGQVSLETFKEKSLIRMDFASILDYGKPLTDKEPEATPATKTKSRK